MADTLHLQIATPERQLVDESVTQVEIPGKNGYLGILPEHAPLLSELGAGVLTYSGGNGADKVLAIEGGFVEVLNNEVRVLAERAEFSKAINAEQARRELDEAQAAVMKPSPETDSDEALQRLAGAQARVDATNRS
jgi:F-type H+-transporting ATPase subunit epsilon